MDFDLLLRNRGVTRVVVGIPAGHQHIRARIETTSGDVITLQEATLAALARAYLDVSTHPRRHALELRSTPVADGKAGFAEYQLLEARTDESALRRELAAAPVAAAPAAPEHASPMSPDASFADQPGPAGETTAPHRAEDLARAAQLTDHGRPEVEASADLGDDLEDDLDDLDDLEDDADDLELDEPDDLELDEPDDGPVFGDVPTLHSKPKKRSAAPKKRRRGRK